MANTIKLKRGTSTPSTSDIASGEVAIDTSAQKLYINDSGTVKEIGGGGSSIGGNTGVDFNDNVKARWGTGNDLEIYHDGTSVGYIKNTSGLLKILSDNQVSIADADNNEDLAKFIDNGSCELYYDNVKKLSTTSSGALCEGSGIVIFQISSSDNDAVLSLKAAGNNDTDWSIRNDLSESNELGFRFNNNTRMRLDSSGNLTVLGDIDIGDNDKLLIGAGDDLQIYHDGSNSFVQDIGTGELKIAGNVVRIVNAGNSETQFKATQNSAVLLYYDNSKKLQTTSDGITMSGHIDLPDQKEVRIGGASLRLRHDGHSIIQNDESGACMFISSHETQFANTGLTEAQAKFFQDGAVELYYDNSKKFHTTTNGPAVSSGGADDSKLYFLTGSHTTTRIGYVGHSQFGLDVNGGVHIRDAGNSYETMLKTISNGAVELYYDGVKKVETMNGGLSVTGQVAVAGSGVSLSIADSGKAAFGNGDDLKIWHDGTHTRLNNATGNFNVQTGAFVVTNVANSENLIIATQNGDVELYYDNSKKLETVSGGINVVGYVNVQSSGQIYIEDGGKLNVGTSNDLQIYHSNSGGANFIETGSQIIHIQSDSSIRLQKNTGSENMLIASADGAVNLYHDNSLKLETTSYGVFVTGTFRADVIDMQDNKKSNWGDGDDLQIYHDGTDTYLTNTTGNTLIGGSAGNAVYIQGKAGEGSIVCAADGAVSLYYDGVKKAVTASTGFHIYSGNLSMNDNQKVAIGASNDFQLYHDGSVNRIVGTGSHDIEVYTSNTKRFTIGSNGNTTYLDDVKSIYGTGSDLRIYHDGSNSYVSQVTAGQNLFLKGDAVQIRSASNEQIIETAANGSVSLYYDNVKTLQTAASGNVHIAGAADLRLTLGSQGTAGTNNANWLRADTTNLMYNSASGHHTWEVGGNTEARLTSNGYFKALGTATSFINATDAYHEFQQTNESNVTAYFKSETASSSYGIVITTSTDDAGQYAIRVKGDNVDRFYVRNDGDCENANNRYQAISDIKLKENVVDANSQWNDIKGIKVRNYNYKSSSGYKTHKQIGVIAQELETVCPNLVSETPDLDDENNNLGTTTKKVAYSVLYMKAIKALQEAITKIETLETKVAALEA